MSKLATRLIFQPQLQYLPVIINDKNDQTMVKALVDSGCAQTAISSKLYKNLLKINPALQLRKCNARIQTCDGTTHGIDGIALLNLTIGDQKLITIHTNVMVVANLADEMLIGSDILQSSLVAKTTPKAIYFKSPQTKKVVIEPFKITVFPMQPIKICQIGMLPPNRSLIMGTTISGFKSLESAISISNQDNNPFKITKIAMDRDEITIKVTNLSPINQSMDIPLKAFQ
ncbi:MAG: gag-polyprotein putative aspartyl protease, partial [Cyanobacteriota bacterium]